MYFPLDYVFTINFLIFKPLSGVLFSVFVYLVDRNLECP